MDSYKNKSKKILLFFATFLFLNVQNAVSQDFNKEEQYKQALQNAKLAFQAEQYSQAVVFYREALNIKPNALLPKYKIEDIRTIYIKKEMEAIQTVEKKDKKRKRKKVKKETIEKEAEVLATKKMNQEADRVLKELDELKTVAEVLNINDSINLDIEEVQVDDTEPDREIAMNEIETRKNKTISFEKPKKQITAKPKNLKETKESVVNKKEIAAKHQLTKKKNKLPLKQKNSIKKSTAKSDKKNPEWVKKEHIRLAKKYPNKKTIEEIEKPQKHITRIIMNIDGKVTTYLKVKHSWGATFYFIDEVGLDLRSISQTYFFSMTDLNTYKK